MKEEEGGGWMQKKVVCRFSIGVFPPLWIVDGRVWIGTKMPGFFKELLFTHSFCTDIQGVVWGKVVYQ